MVENVSNVLTLFSVISKMLADVSSKLLNAKWRRRGSSGMFQADLELKDIIFNSFVPSNFSKSLYNFGPTHLVFFWHQEPPTPCVNDVDDLSRLSCWQTKYCLWHELNLRISGPSCLCQGGPNELAHSVYHKRGARNIYLDLSQLIASDILPWYVSLVFLIIYNRYSLA